MKSKISKRLLYAALPAFALCAAGRSYAEEPAAQGRVEEIVVTAQHRSENLQSVPIAINAIEGPAALALGIKDTTDLQMSTPGLVMRHITNTLSPSLRGISQSSAAAGDESPVAIYVDGVYYAEPTSGVFAFNNIERIEVLKGPQGTLFGRNAAGGVVQVITKKPQQDTAVDMSVGYANYDTYEGNLYATTGITSNLATNLAVYWHHQYDGWGKNLTTGAKTFTNQEFAIRNKWLLDIGEATHVLVSGDYDRAAGQAGVAKDPIPGTTPSVGTPHQGGYYDLENNVNPYTLTKAWGASAQIDHDFDWARLVSISAIRGTNPHVFFDQDATAVNFVNVESPVNTHQYTQELQLLSPDSSRIKWIGGLFYLNHHAKAGLTQSGLAVPAPLNFKTTTSKLGTESVAGFGEVTVPVFSDDTHLTGGLRYTSDKQSIFGFAYTALGTLAGTTGNQRQTFNKLTWRASLTHNFTPDLMTYFSYNRGFKSGVYNATSPLDAATHPSVLDAYEGGVKSQWLDGRLRLNGSVYYYDYSGVQLSLTVLGATHLLNAAQAQVKGSDWDFEIIPVDRLTLRGGLSYNDSKYTDFLNAPLPVPKPTGGYNTVSANGSGNKLMYTPKWTFNTGVQYKIPTENGAYGINLNYYYSGGYFGDPANYFYQPSYQIVNASVDWTSINDKWNVMLWAKNLNNARYYVQYTFYSQNATAAPSAPRSFGITFDYKFGGK